MSQAPHNELLWCVIVQDMCHKLLIMNSAVHDCTVIGEDVCHEYHCILCRVRILHGKLLQWERTISMEKLS